MRVQKTQVSAGGLRPKITPAEIFLLMAADAAGYPNQGAGRPSVTCTPLNWEYSSKP